MTPSDLEVLIHMHCCPERHPRSDAPAVAEAVEWFIDQKIIEPSSWDGPNANPYQTTERGKIWLEMILKTPMPEMKWIDPREEQP